MADDTSGNTGETSNATLIELAAELTMAWLSNPNAKLTADELPGVIQKIHGALAGLGSSGEEAATVPEYTPAVTVRRSLASDEHIISMIDGRPYKMLKRHLGQNGLTPEQYRERYALKADYPMVAPTYAAKRRELAKKIGLGRKPGHKAEAPKPAAKRAPRKTKTTETNLAKQP